MAELRGTLTTPDTRRIKAAAAFGAATTSVFDIVKRDDYENEAAYIKALYETEQFMQSDTYREYHRKAVAEEREKQEKAIIDEQNAAFATAKKSATLNPTQLDGINAEAARLAHDDLAKGRITPQQLGKAIADHAEKLTDKAKSDIAAADVFNKVIRGELRGLNADTEG